MPMTNAGSIRLGTRGSLLARWQADWVSRQLEQLGVAVQLVPISTQGDLQQAGPIGSLGGTGVFTKEIQRALLEGEVDLAVHSLKDLPTDPVEALMLSAVPARGPSGDMLVTPRRLTLDELPQGARVGTGSHRRRAQLWHARPDLKIEDIRGNVETRLRKLREGQFDALVLAEAGLTRLQMAAEEACLLPRSVMLPAIGQGALGLETRTEDTATRRLIEPLNDPATHQAVLAERSLLATLRGGCLAPIGAWGRIEADGRLHLSAVVLSDDGRQRLQAEDTAPPDEAQSLGERLAGKLLEQGARELIESAREGT